MKKRILVVEDEEKLRRVIELQLNVAGFEVDKAGNAEEGLKVVDRADLVLTDLKLPNMDGLEACQIIRKEQPATQVLMLTMHESEEYFLQALRMGAAGYLVKKAAPSDLRMAINAISQGGAFLYPGLAKALIRSYVASPASATLASHDHETVNTSSLAQALRVLTPREVEVLKLVAEGRTNQEIADQWTLSIKTVQTHRANVMEKLDLRDITHLVRFAIKHRLIAE